MGRDRPRVVYFGMDSEFSSRPLLALLRSGAEVVAVVKPIGGVALRRTNVATRVPGLMTRVRAAWWHLWHGRGPPASADGTVPDDPFELAEELRIPCFLVGDASASRALAVLRRLDADVYCVAFFNQLFRRGLLALPRLGAVNLHPSLLPAYRGPAPLFWTFHDALPETGLTLHLLAPGEDDGDILQQRRLPMPDGLRGPALVSAMAREGAEMMVQGVWDLFRGTAQPTRQELARAFRSPRPEGEDLRVRFDRDARAVFNFVRGVSLWVPLWAQVGHDRVDVVDAQGFEPGKTLPVDHVWSGTTLLVQCRDGVVALTVRARAWGFPSAPTAPHKAETPRPDAEKRPH
ncbi:MAG: hypothetical protein HY904_06390 [Deltaproteobacteria bacterium]|nr:hypothetical protein [Deltaproteobacteria bacterium]